LKKEHAAIIASHQQQTQQQWFVFYLFVCLNVYLFQCYLEEFL
jgi:hypothetical protein